MPDAIFRFYASLNDFLSPSRRVVAFSHRFDNRATVKDVVESLGVPHPEVDLLTVNGVPVDFSYHLQAGDRVGVFPLFASLDVEAISLVRPARLDEFRFVLDTHLGRLAAYLRLAGFDTLYGNDWDDQRLAGISSRERRILLTRDTALLKRSIVTYGYWLRETNPRRQLTEVSNRLGLVPRMHPFRRCLRCNSVIERVAKAAIADRLPSRTRARYDEFHRCPGCGGIYWKGSHYEWMRKLLGNLAKSG